MVATVIVKTADGLFEITRFTADSNGRFRVPLPPGTVGPASVTATPVKLLEK